VGQAFVLLAARPLFKCGSYTGFAVSNAKPALSYAMPLAAEDRGMHYYELIARVLHIPVARVILF
jgi:hypothetical protein